VFHCQPSDRGGRRASRAWTAAGLALTLVALSACSAAQQTASQGETAVHERNWDAAVFYYLQALAEDPDNVEYRMQLTRARQKAAQQHFQKGLTLEHLGQLHAARDEFQMTIQLDPTHQFAAQKMEDVQADIEILEGPGGADQLAEIKRRAREAKVKPPVLDPTSKDPITLNFPQEKPLKEIYKALGKAYGFNVLFDKDLREQKLAIELADVNAEQALEMTMRAGSHFYKVLDEHSIIVIDDTPQKRREYEDLVIKTFFLSNADVKEVDKLLRALIEARRLATNEQLNAITLRDSADKVAIAERLIRTNDKAKAEVLVDVELLLISSNNDTNLGMTLSTYSFILGTDTTLIGDNDREGSLPLNALNGINSSNSFINIPSLLINLVKTSGRSEVLAQPQLRITEGEKANLHIGDRYPIPVTSFNTSNTVGANVVPITSFQYQDIGIKIDVEPRVHHNREVTLNLSVEVSNLGATVEVGQGQSAVVIGTRTITSVIRLQSGETSLLAGLFRNDTTEGVIETPGISSIPLLGRLFTNKSKTYTRTDLVLTLTPHIVRFPDIEEEDLAPVWVGTENNISFHGSTSPRMMSGRAEKGPFDQQPRSSADRDEQEQRRPQTTTPPRQGRAYGLPQSRRAEPQGGGTSPGVELSGGSKALGVDDGTGDGSGLVPDTTMAPLILSLNPSVSTLNEGDEAVIQILATGPYSDIRFPVSLGFDPQRVAVERVDAPGTVAVIDMVVDEANGWLDLELVSTGAGTAQTPVASIVVRALDDGGAALTLASGLATAADGTHPPVSTTDGALFIVSAGGPSP
jgi:general secretion pathway protein D